jgi:predicted ArsR family transcriptional regulator
MNHTLQAELQKRIEAFAADITSVLQRAVADSVAAVLQGTARPTSARTASSAKAAATAVRRTSISANELYAVLLADGNRNIEKIAQGLGVKTAVIAPVLKDLVAHGSVRRSGQARGTRYSVVPGKAPASSTTAGRKAAAATAARPGSRKESAQAAKTTKKARAAAGKTAKKAKKTAKSAASALARVSDKAPETIAEKAAENAVDAATTHQPPA